MENEFRAFLRHLADKVNNQVAKGGIFERQIADLKGAVDRLLEGSAKSEADIESIRQLAGVHPFQSRLEAEVAKSFPDWGFFTLVESADVPSASTADIPINLQISAGTWFFIRRLYLSWRPTAGANANTWRPIGTSHPTIAVAAAPADIFNFWWQFSDTWSSRRRQNNPIPGDVLFRLDQDGYLPGSDGWPPDTTVSFIITPTIAMANAGRITLSAFGVQYMKGLPKK